MTHDRNRNNATTAENGPAVTDAVFRSSAFSKTVLDGSSSGMLWVQVRNVAVQAYRSRP